MRKIKELVLKTPWLTANFITALRFIACFPLFFLVWKEKYLIAFFVFLVMSFTDSLDGYLARLKATGSEKGVIFDSFTDMFFFLPSFFILGLKFLDTRVFIVLFLLEIIRIIMAPIIKFLNHRVILKANVGGKIKSWFEVFGLGALLLNPYKLSPLANLLFLIAIILALLSLTLHFLKVFRKNK